MMRSGMIHAPRRKSEVYYYFYHAINPARPVRRPPRAASSRLSSSCGWTEEFLSVQDPRLELPTCVILKNPVLR